MLRRDSFSAVQWLLLAIFTVYCLLPLWWVVTTMFKDNGQLFSTFGLWFSSPSHFSDNLNALFTRDSGIFSRWLLNSVIYAGATALGSMMVSAMAGYAFSKFDFAGKRAIFTTILATIMVPSTALALPIFLLMQKTGLLNTYWAVILPGLVNPFGLYLMRLFWDAGFPKELMEAARIDGARSWRRFRTITLPLLAPTIFFLLVVNLVYAAFETFSTILALTGGGPGKATETLIVKVYRDGVVNLDLGSSSAQSVILMGAVILLTAVQFRFMGRKSAD